jgi:hypothetical protein
VPGARSLRLLVAADPLGVDCAAVAALEHLKIRDLLVIDVDYHRGEEVSVLQARQRHVGNVATVVPIFTFLFGIVLFSSPVRVAGVLAGASVVVVAGGGVVAAGAEVRVAQRARIHQFVALRTAVFFH